MNDECNILFIYLFLSLKPCCVFEAQTKISDKRNVIFDSSDMKAYLWGPWWGQYVVQASSKGH